MCKNTLYYFRVFFKTTLKKERIEYLLKVHNFINGISTRLYILFKNVKLSKFSSLKKEKESVYLIIKFW